MTWILSLVIGLLAGGLGLVVGGVVAGLAVDWYRISSFEGGAGYFVMFDALFGGVAGFVIGVVVSRVVAARPRPGFLKAAAAACGVVLAIGGATAGIARLLADVPPEIDGQGVFVSVELRWPDGGAPSEAMRGQPGVVTLGAMSGLTLRASEDGPLFVDRASQVDGHWVVPGEVRVFTGRGRRLLMFRVGETELPAFGLPLPGQPDASNRAWSEWLPKTSDAAAAQGFRYRYRVRLANEAMRVDRAGPFTIETRADGFFHVQGSEFFAADSNFGIRFHDAPVPGLEHAASVAVLPAPVAALLVTADSSGECSLVREREGRAEVTRIGACGSLAEARPITDDQARFEASRTSTALRGWVDTTTFKEPGFYQINQFVLDTQSLTAQKFEYPAGYAPYGPAFPVTLAPDEQSFAVLAEDRDRDQLALLVIQRVSGESYPLPIDRRRMRYTEETEIGPAWVAHHFVWEKGSGGSARLQERPGFVPLPHHGALALAKPGEFQSYTLRPGGTPLRDAIVQILIERMGGQRLPEPYSGAEPRVSVDGHELHFTLVEMPSYVMLSMDAPVGDPAFMGRLAKQLDDILATGTLDPLFVEPPRP